MDTLTRYRNAIKQVILEHAQHESALKDIRTEVIFDETNDHYALVESGWHDMMRIEGQVIHIDIIDGKIWIQFDGTQNGVARELEAMGISKQEIVLGFHSPAKRPYTEYAVG
jgi:hypothetical protein